MRDVANGRDGVEVAQHRQSREVDDLGHLAGSEDAYAEDLIGHDQNLLNEYSFVFMYDFAECAICGKKRS